jgi:serpin B
LKNNYYASTFQGEMGSPDYNKALQSWLNEQTGGLLENHTSKEGFDSLTVIALVSMVYFNARWYEEFSKNKNTDETFHSPSGDITCEFMHQQIDSEYFYWGENFSAIRKTFTAGGSMRFILPNDGVSVDSLLSDEEALALMTSGDRYKNQKGMRINLSMPKFDVDSSLDLQKGLKNLGVRSCFDVESSDFSPIIDGESIRVRKVSHGARVKLDEEGVVAAAYTLIDAGSNGRPDDEVDFVLDRPFIFVITNSDGLPLFVGVVNKP